jgi:hypothetical protein
MSLYLSCVPKVLNSKNMDHFHIISAKFNFSTHILKIINFYFVSKFAEQIHIENIATALDGSIYCKKCNYKLFDCDAYLNLIFGFFNMELRCLSQILALVFRK